MVVKENFCGACLTIPLAFASAGTAIGAEKKSQVEAMGNNFYNSFYCIDSLLCLH